MLFASNFTSLLKVRTLVVLVLSQFVTCWCSQKRATRQEYSDDYLFPDISQALIMLKGTLHLMTSMDNLKVTYLRGEKKSFATAPAARKTEILESIMILRGDADRITDKLSYFSPKRVSVKVSKKVMKQALRYGKASTCYKTVNTKLSKALRDIFGLQKYVEVVDQIKSFLDGKVKIIQGVLVECLEPSTGRGFYEIKNDTCLLQFLGIERKDSSSNENEKDVIYYKERIDALCSLHETLVNIWKHYSTKKI